ncbi:hypothetical protein EDD76_103163 [Kineothrix alysoides]|uniref:Uncharacterized protein n=1 Tax=Kineothrix alysoides TaxID=1469948 RepID=A0A4R1R3S3_9FIRM|nr:hypothetical protein [Kineothrix alysoides]TCL59972.1 hypothetical protein EDD76_103163 [Kineothrix alysoides]
MKLSLNCGVMILAKNSRVGTNGNTYYNLAILQDSEAGTISCSKEVFESVDPMKPYGLQFSYNDQYKSLSVSGVLLSNEKESVSNSDLKTPDKK